jgi:NosR/NirI family transcriptional regulator, nitrous oxide reductase regulator
VSGRLGIVSTRRFKRRMKAAVLVLPIALALLVCSAEQRFPPPEFETGHQLPLTTEPAPRHPVLQYLDVAVLACALATASWLIYKKRSRRGLVALSIFSVVYFGFYRKGCICSIGSLQNVALAFCDRSYAVPVTVTAFFALPLVFALLAGRSFCAGVCPHGALQDLVLLKPIKLPAWLEHGLSILPYIYLGAGVLFAATGSAFIICQYDPFVPVFRMSGRTSMVLAGVVLLLLGMFVGRPYCRFLCPYGALLKLGSIVSKWRVRVTPDSCTQCGLCESSCPFGAMREPESVKTGAATRVVDRRRLAWLLLLLPMLVAGGGWLGFKFSGPASRVHPTVSLAEKSLRAQKSAELSSFRTPESLALNRARQSSQEILPEALSIQRRFVMGGWIFGGWVGLVIGAKLISLSLRRTRAEYEPDRGACFACARCFSFCPNELVRRGLMPDATAAEISADANAAVCAKS